MILTNKGHAIMAWGKLIMTESEGSEGVEDKRWEDGMRKIEEGDRILLRRKPLGWDLGGGTSGEALALHTLTLTPKDNFRDTN